VGVGVSREKILTPTPVTEMQEEKGHKAKQKEKEK
jgi:hypothetical protein